MTKRVSLSQNCRRNAVTGWYRPALAMFGQTNVSKTARRQLYANLSPILPDPHRYVVDRIARSIDHYVNRFHLFNANRLFDHDDRVTQERDS